MQIQTPHAPRGCLKTPPVPRGCLKTPPVPRGCLKTPPVPRGCLKTPPVPRGCLKTPPVPRGCLKTPPVPRGWLKTPPVPRGWLKTLQECDDTWDVSLPPISVNIVQCSITKTLHSCKRMWRTLHWIVHHTNGKWTFCTIPTTATLVAMTSASKVTMKANSSEHVGVHTICTPHVGRPPTNDT